jgi:hypothetical protein
LWNEKPELKVPLHKKTNIKPIKKLINQKNEINKYLPQTALCFIKISTFKKQAIEATFTAVLDKLKAEMISIKVVRAKKEIYNQNVP